MYDYGSAIMHSRCFAGMTGVTDWRDFGSFIIIIIIIEMMQLAFGY